MDRPVWFATSADWFSACGHVADRALRLPGARGEQVGDVGHLVALQLEHRQGGGAGLGGVGDSSCPAAARFRAPVRPPPMMSVADTPALAISVMPCAASSVAEYWVSAPALMATSRSAQGRRRSPGGGLHLRHRRAEVHALVRGVAEAEGDRPRARR
jgi:hypothetical protein